MDCVAAGSAFLLQGQGYDATRNAEYWATRPVPVTARVLVIAAEMGAWWIRAQLRHRNNPRAAAAELREVRAAGIARVEAGTQESRFSRHCSNAL